MKRSSGLLVWREKSQKIEILLVHHGGPFWKNKDENAWSIPKGEIEKTEGIKSTAIREFKEETGLDLTISEIKRLKYLGKVFGYNKMVYVFVLKKNFGNKINPKPNQIKMKIGSRYFTFPEIDKISYFNLKLAKEKLVIYQKMIIPLFEEYLKNNLINY
jgi:predicted NUDIX family NTP pyrophosphohydrolase